MTAARAVRSVEAAYIAGLFDGEGCVHIARAQARDRPWPTYWLMVTITNTNHGLIEDLKARFGGNISSNRVDKPTHRPCRTWQIGARQALAFLRIIRPYTRLKSAEIDLGIAFQKSKDRWRQKPLTPAVIEEREALKKSLSGLRSATPTR